jgi:hypothetical protein
LTAPGFNPLTYTVRNSFQAFAFKMQLVPLHCLVQQGTLDNTTTTPTNPTTATADATAAVDNVTAAAVTAYDDVAAATATAAAASTAAANVFALVASGGGGRVGIFHHVILQSKHQLMTAGMPPETNLTPGSECNPAWRRSGWRRPPPAGSYGLAVGHRGGAVQVSCIQLTHSLKPPGFNPRTHKSDLLVPSLPLTRGMMQNNKLPKPLSFPFQTQLVPLRRGAVPRAHARPRREPRGGAEHKSKPVDP